MNSRENKSKNSKKELLRIRKKGLIECIKKKICSEVFFRIRWRRSREGNREKRKNNWDISIKYRDIKSMLQKQKNKKGQDAKKINAGMMKT